MKIATWNVNSIRTRLPIVLDWLKNNAIEVLCLQETKVTDADFPRSSFEELGYHLYISGQKSYNGVAIFSRQPLTEVTIGFSPVVGTDLGGELDEQKRIIAGIVPMVRRSTVINIFIKCVGWQRSKITSKQ
jgi:exodeoxyribonuclease III